MKKSDELKQERAGLIEAQQTLNDTIEARDGKYSDAETETFKTRQAEIKALDGKIEMQEQIEANAKRAAAASGAAGKSVVDGEKNEMDKGMKRYSVHKLMRSLLPNQKLDGIEAEMHQEMSKRAKNSGIEITGLAMPTELRADGQTVTQDSGANGANLVAEDLGSPIEFLRPKPVLRQMGARYFTGLQGNVAFPTNDGGIESTWEGEITEVSASKNAYGKKTMNPNRLASTVPVSMQNLFQSNIDLERYTIDEINAVVANKLDLAGINGSGTGNIPLGILNAAGINTIVGGTNGAAPTWSHIVDMESAVYVANANSAKMGYLINSGTKGRLKKTKHEAGDLGYLMGMDNSINGSSVAVSNLVPGDLTKGTLAGTANAGIFGDFSQLLIGQWGFYDLDIDKKAKEGIYDITVNAFFDVLVRQAKAFAVIKDWDLS